jgi:tetratricopeptide (TPR) repeat protein
MPHTINGIGTWYYGKRDIHRIKSTCEQCDKLGELASYDTTLYFVVFFVPVIPLQNYRVIEDCPHCQRHRVLKSKEWNRLKEEGRAECLAALEANPRDREKMKAAIGHAHSFQDAAFLDQLKPHAERFQEDAEVQAQLGGAMSYFSRRQEATEAYKLSLLAEDKPEVRRLLAINLLRQGDPDQAEPLARHVMEEKLAEHMYLPILLVETYQTQGKHQQALDVLQEIEEAFPEVLKDKYFKKLRADSTRYLDSGKALRRATLVDGSNSGTSQGSNASRWIPIILGIALLTGYLGRTIWLGMNSPIYLVNGGSRPYQVTIQGTTYTLAPGRPSLAHVTEGDVTVEIVDASLGIPAVPVKVETPFFTRAFSRPLVVVNPDETAMLSQETCLYAQHPPPSPPGTTLPFKAVHQMTEPDYVFEEFPPQISVKGNKTITKTRVGIERPTSTTNHLRELEFEVPDQAQLVARIKRLAQIDPNDNQYIHWLSSRLAPEAMIAFTKPRLNQPETQTVLVEWHRSYQEACARMKPPVDVTAEYRERLAKSNDQCRRQHQYLLGRITNDPEGFELIRQAAQGERPCFQAVNTVGQRAMQTGEFEEAARWAEKLRELDPANPVTKLLMTEQLTARRKYKELADHLDSMSYPDPFEKMMATFKIYQVALLRNDADRAARVKAEVTATLRRAVPDELKMIETLLAATEAVTQGDTARFLEIQSAEHARPHIAVPLLRKDLPAAINMVEKTENTDRLFLSQCLVYLLARQLKNEEVATQYWNKILEKQRLNSRTNKAFLSSLEGKTPFTMALVNGAYTSTDEKRALLLVLADRFPAEATPLRQLADKLNFQLDAFALVIKTWLKESVKH